MAANVDFREVMAREPLAGNGVSSDVILNALAKTGAEHAISAREHGNGFGGAEPYPAQRCQMPGMRHLMASATGTCTDGRVGDTAKT